MASGIFVVATPIGNLEDLSPRARRVLEEVDLIAAEDTRHTYKLLNLVGIKNKKLVSYHEHNELERASEICDQIERDQIRVALVSDAGTPCISDPGYRLVALARSRGISVTPVAGPSAAMALVSVSGLSVSRFMFLGFLPNKLAAKQREIGEWSESLGSVVFYESARRLIETLEVIAQIWPQSSVAVGRELTKLHEEIVQDSIDKVLIWAQEKKEILGEVVVMVSGFSPSSEAIESHLEEVRSLAKTGFLSGKSLKDLQKELSKNGLERNALYQLLLEVKKEIS